MDRIIVYPGSIPLDTDLLNTNRNAMVALGALIRATLGTGPLVDGLALAPASAVGLAVSVGPGSIIQLAALDQAAYGSLPADTQDQVVKMGVSLSTTVLQLAAPSVAGQSIAYMIQASFLESDTGAVVLPYYNAANPAQPFLGPANSGAAQPTARAQGVQVQLKAGAAAIAGQQTAPPVDAGWVGLGIIVVSYGQTAVTQASISPVPGAPILQAKLPDLRPGFSNLLAITASGSFTVPTGVTRVKVTVTGGGGAGGTHASQAGGGGGAGGQAVSVIAGLTPGSVIPVTVGSAGAAPAGAANGGNGGTSSFGSFVSATGGLGGVGGSGSGTCAGSSGGVGVGGGVNEAGGFGTDAVDASGKGGDGGGPGNGRGSSGPVAAVAAAGYGGGGGGGGGSGGTGASGGPGIVIVEW
jgi:hypothetical protein